MPIAGEKYTMKTINPEYIERVNQLVNRSPYFDLLSMKIIEVGAGFSKLEIDLAPKHLQPFGFVHGGVFASIIDAASFWALFYEIDDPDTGATTVDLKLNYLAPAAAGKLIAKGRQIKLGRTLGYADAEVTDAEGRILAHGSSTVILLPGQGLGANPPLPPKFL
jgi:uncharacterized protein (TIGR00369 family)